MPWSVVVKEGKPRFGKKGKNGKGGGKKPHNSNVGKGGQDESPASPSMQYAWHPQPHVVGLPSTPPSPPQAGLPLAGNAPADSHRAAASPTSKVGSSAAPVTPVDHCKQVRKDAGGAIESLKKILATVAGASLWEGKDSLVAMLEGEIAAHKQAIIESKPPGAQLAGATELKARLEAKFATLRQQWADLGKQKQLAVAEWDAKLQKKLDDINIIGASIATCKSRIIQLTRHVAMAEGAQCIATPPASPFNFGVQRQNVATPAAAWPLASPGTPPPAQEDPYLLVKAGVLNRDEQMVGPSGDDELHFAALQQQQQLACFRPGYMLAAAGSSPIHPPAQFIIADDEELGSLLQEAALTLDAAGVAPSDQQVAYALHAAIATAASQEQKQEMLPPPPTQAVAAALHQAIAHSVSSGSLSIDDAGQSAKPRRGRSRSKSRHVAGQVSLQPFRNSRLSRGRRAISLSQAAAAGQ